MSAYLEVWGSAGPEPLPLNADKITVGKSRTNDLVISNDGTVSRMHAVLEPLASGWCVRDLGSRNGTYVNGERVLGERALHAGDEIRVGSTRLVFRADPRAGAHTTATHTAKQAPELTRRERDVLVELCRPLVSGDLFTEPASTREIAECLFLTEPTVKQHLQHLYPKFGIHEGVRRRARLANEAVARGAVNLAELRRQP